MDTSDLPSRELTIDEAIAVAIGLQKQQHLPRRSSSTPGCSKSRHNIRTRCTT